MSKKHRSTKKVVAKKAKKLLSHKERSAIQTKAAHKAWRTIRARAKEKQAKIEARAKARRATKAVKIAKEAVAKKPAASVPGVAVKVVA
jgi:hypothetical protein